MQSGCGVGEAGGVRCVCVRGERGCEEVTKRGKLEKKGSKVGKG